MHRPIKNHFITRECSAHIRIASFAVNEYKRIFDINRRFANKVHICQNWHERSISVRSVQLSLELLGQRHGCPVFEERSTQA
jgi:hypothetical protein